MISRSELQIDFARSGGPGGQNVNKTNTKVIVRWNIGHSRSITGEQKQRIRQKLHNRISWGDDLIVTSEAERSQLQNKQRAVAQLLSLVRDTLIVPKPRKATKPTKASKHRRFEHKTKRSLVKRARRSVFD
jgi:ribosome-associated protein